MSPQWKNYPLILQTLVNHQQLQSSMQSPHLTDMEVTVSPAANWYSLAQMANVLWDPMNNAASTEVLMIEVIPKGSRCFIFSTPQPVSPHKPIPHWHLGWWYTLPPKKTSQQCHWMMMYSLKTPFQIDDCVSMRHLTSQITSVPIPAHTKTPPSEWIYHSQCHEMKEYFTMILWTSVTSHQILQTSWQQEVTMMFLIL